MYPVLAGFGPVTVFSYGVMIAFGILSAGILCRRHAARRAIAPDAVIDVIFWIVIFGLLGGRLGYVLINADYYRHLPWEIIRLSRGGLVFHGGLLGGALAAVIFIRKNKLPLRKTLDIIAVYVPLAHAFGRVGCFLNGCCYGKPVSSRFGVVFPGEVVPVLPVQLYAAGALIALFLILFLREGRKQFDGEIFSLYIILYALLRFFLEFLRNDSTLLWDAVTVFQIISVVLFGAGIGMYRHLARKSRS